MMSHRNASSEAARCQQECGVRGCGQQVCEILFFACGFLAALLGGVNVYDDLRLKEHGFELEDIVVTPNGLGEDRSADRGPIDGYDVAWLRKERWGAISSEVDITIRQDDSEGQVRLCIPVGSLEVESTEAQKAIDSLSRVIADYDCDKQEVARSIANLLKGLLEHEGRVVRGNPRGLRGDDQGVVITGAEEITYSYYPYPGRDVLRRCFFNGILLLGGTGVSVLALNLLHGKRRGRRAIILLQLAVAIVFVLYNDVWKWRESVTLAARVVHCVGVFVFGVMPVLVAVLYSIIGISAVPSPPPHCRACGYSLHGNESGICPECGCQLNSPPCSDD